MTAPADASSPFARLELETPIGDVLIVTSGTGLVALRVLDGPDDDALAEVSAQLRQVPVPAARLASDEAGLRTAADAGDEPDAARWCAVVAGQLDEYFAGDRRDFDVPIDWRLVGDDGFVRRALAAVCEVPYGETASYGEVAVMAGSPGAHRAAGSACARTPISIVVPAHRVVRSDGSIGEYGGRPEIKRFLLDHEATAAGAAPAGTARLGARRA